MKFRSALAVSALLCMFAFAADHKEAPGVAGNPRADINDLYVFMSPENPDNVVLVMTVNPFSSPVEGTSETFAVQYDYFFLIDNNGDAFEDYSIQIDFNADQTFTASFSNGMIINGNATPASVGETPNQPQVFSNDSGMVSVFAGPRDDPFFFDVVGFSRTLGGTGNFTGTDGFAGFNVSAIAVEMPASMLVMDGSTTLNVWAATGRRSTPFKRAVSNERFFRTVDRMGNPAVATALIPTGKKDAYNAGIPANDAADFAGDIVASLTALGTSEENIGILASVAVPDLLTIDTSAPSGFPNGRDLDDDVIDVLFSFIFNQQGVSDGVDSNDVEFMASFPYMAGPWQPE